MDDPVSAGRPASSLNTVTNDTGRAAFCGPYVLSAITGYGISRIEDVIRACAWTFPRAESPSCGAPTPMRSKPRWPTSVYRMVLKETHLNKARKERPTVWSWMQKPRNAWAYYILAIHKGKRAILISVKGVRVTPSRKGNGHSWSMARTGAAGSTGSVRGQEGDRRLNAQGHRRHPHSRIASHVVRLVLPASSLLLIAAFVMSLWARAKTSKSNT